MFGKPSKQQKLILVQAYEQALPRLTSSYRTKRSMVPDFVPTPPLDLRSPGNRENICIQLISLIRENDLSGRSQSEIERILRPMLAIPRADMVASAAIYLADCVNRIDYLIGAYYRLYPRYRPLVIMATECQTLGTNAVAQTVGLSWPEEACQTWTFFAREFNQRRRLNNWPDLNGPSINEQQAERALRASARRCDAPT